MAIGPGTRVGPYEIRSLLGAGGMGEVFLAHDDRLRRDVAIKVLPAQFATDPDRLRRFESEARAASQLNHPNILTVFDVGTDNGQPYVVSERLEGETLRERLVRGPVAEREALEWARQVARGLAAAHGRGIVHRDLKPENLFLTRDGHVKILDFGLAKLSSDGADGGSQTKVQTTYATEPGVIVGTTQYMAPEQVKGQPADHRADLFAFGVVLYEMLTGKSPFSRPSGAESMSAVLNDTPAAGRRSPRRRLAAGGTGRGALSREGRPSSASSRLATSCSRSIPGSTRSGSGSSTQASTRAGCEVQGRRLRRPPRRGGCGRRPRHGLVGRRVSNPDRDGAGFRTGHEAGGHRRL